jgi:hypothetical protein
MNLDFPYHMTEQNCDGTVRMTITLPEKLGPAKGTMEATGCGDPTQRVSGTVELKPSTPKPAGRGGEDSNFEARSDRRQR